MRNSRIVCGNNNFEILYSYCLRFIFDNHLDVNMKTRLID